MSTLSQGVKYLKDKINFDMSDELVRDDIEFSKAATFVSISLELQEMNHHLHDIKESLQIMNGTYED